MKKTNTYSIRLLTYTFVLGMLLVAACSSPRISQLNSPVMQTAGANISGTDADLVAEDALTAQVAEEATADQLLSASASSDMSIVAAAATRPVAEVTTLASEGNVKQNATSVQTQAGAIKNTAQKQMIAKKLSFPARVMLKSIVKKAQKVEKKRLDIKQAKQAKDVNNGGYLIAGLILAIAGLVLIIAGNTTLLYILGAGASLAGLVFLLLALL